MGTMADAMNRARAEAAESGAKSAPFLDRSVPIVDVPSFGGLLDGHAGGDIRPDAPLNWPHPPAEDVVCYHDRGGIVAEQYRSLRTRLLSQNPDNEHRIIGVTSSAPQEGKSVTTANLSLILAELRHLRVLMVDGDFRRGTLPQMLNMPAGPGMAELILERANPDEVLHETPIPNLMFLPAGKIGDKNAAEVLSSANARGVFDMLRQRFHYVIVDTPPINTVTDAGIIGQMCFGVIVLVRIHSTRDSIAKHAIRLLQANNVNVVGALIVGEHRSELGSGYYYTRYYRRRRLHKAGDDGL